MLSKAPLPRSWGFAQSSLPPLIENKFSSSALVRQFSVPIEIFRNSFYCHLLFNYQCSSLSRDSSFRLSHLFAVVNNFFYFFQVLLELAVALLSNENDNNTLSPGCQHLFWKFFQTICTILKTIKGLYFSPNTILFLYLILCAEFCYKIHQDVFII